MMSTSAVHRNPPLDRAASSPVRGYVGLLAYLRSGSVPHTLAAPVIYSLLIPFVLLDLWVTVFQWATFPLYRIPRVRRADYVVLDRQTLAYLNPLEKLNCLFCGYVNGVVAYVREVGALTEQYWCPIKHAQPVRAPHDHYPHFVEFGDADAYRHRLMALRRQLRRRDNDGRR